MMKAIILDGEIEQIVISTNDGMTLDGRTIHEMTPEEIVLSQSGRAYAWDGTGLVPRLDGVKRKKLDAISAAFEAQVRLGCASPLGRVDCDDQAQVRIANIIALRERAVAANIPIDPLVRWTMLDGSQVDHDDAALQALGFAIGFGFAAKFAVKQAHEQAVADSIDNEAVEEIDPSLGWPA